LELENAELKMKMKRLEALVEVLYKQNLQYSKTFNQQEACEREVMDQTVRVVANMQFQNHSRMQTIKERVKTDWGNMKVEEVEILEDIKRRIIEKDLRETEEIIIGMYDIVVDEGTTTISDEGNRGQLTIYRQGG